MELTKGFLTEFVCHAYDSFSTESIKKQTKCQSWANKDFAIS